MTELYSGWSLSNPWPHTLLVRLEPWADEIEVPARSTVTLSAADGVEDCLIGELEWTPDHLVVWANAPGRIEARVDGVLQETGSAVIPVPEGLTKQMLNLVFAGQPPARLGGEPLDGPEHVPWWQRVRRRLGL